MKHLVIIFTSVVLSVLLVGLLFYFNLFPKQNALVDEKKNNVEDFKPMEEVKNSIKDVMKQVDRESTCRQASEIMVQIEKECGSMPFPGVEKCIQMRTERAEVELKEENLARAEKMTTLNEQYLSLNKNCN